MREVYAGDNYDLFLSGEDYVVKDKNNRTIFYSPRWVSNYRKLKESVEKLSELGEKNGRKDLIADQINSTLDIYKEDTLLNAPHREEEIIKNDSDNKIYDIKIKKKLSTAELNRLAKELSDNNRVVATSDALQKKIKRLLSESFSSDYVNKIMDIFKTDLCRGLVTITDNISPVAIVDRNPDLKELCQKIIQSYYDQEDFSSFEKVPESEKYEFTSSSYVPYRIMTDGNKFFLEKKTGGSWKVTKKSDNVVTLERALYDIEDKSQEKKEKKERIKEEKKARKAQKKEESKVKKKRRDHWSEY